MIRPLPSGLPILRPETARDPSSAPAMPATSESGLTADEVRMISEVFPEKPAMTLRLYGPGRPGSLQPGGVGGRIDLRG